MTSILLKQWMKEKRNPLVLLIFIILSIAATLMFGGDRGSKIEIEVFSASGEISDSETEWLRLLNSGDTFAFTEQEEKAAKKKLREGRADLTLKLLPDDYRIIAVMEGPNVQLAEQYIYSVYKRELQLRSAAETVQDKLEFRESVQSVLEQPPLKLKLQASDGGAHVPYDMGLQLLFGFTLFFMMFTVGYKVNVITGDKTSGIWNRLILSPLSKTQIYLGHLIYSALAGILQIVVIFLVFHYGLNVKLGDQYGLLLLVIVCYTVTIVAFSILMVGMMRTPEQFHMLFPAVIPIMPLISGVYMPPGTITSSILLAIAEVIPLTHAMEALTSISMYGAGMSDIWLPITKLLLIGVICMGIGINLMERRNA